MVHWMILKGMQTMKKIQIKISKTFEVEADEFENLESWSNSEEKDLMVESVRELVCQIAENEELDFEKEFALEVEEIT